MNSIIKFHTDLFINALKAFFEELKIPIDYVADEPTTAEEILVDNQGKSLYKPNNEAHQLIEDVYFLGMVNDAIFKGNKTFDKMAEVKKLEKDYEGLLIFGITLKNRKDGLPMTKNHLAEITRAFNYTFPYTPVTIIFKYGNLISFANGERIAYKQEWREGEKVGKVTMLKDINVMNPHRGHLDTLQDLRAVRDTETLYPQQITSFDELYKKWLNVFNLKILGDKFYLDIAKWYHWALKDTQKIQFNGEVNKLDYTLKIITRTVFIWFLKEKGLVDRALFDEKTIQYDILQDFSADTSTYYKAVLQTLFFEVLNENIANRFNFQFNKAQNYELWCKDFDKLKQVFNAKTPFVNGGLFDASMAELPTENQNICKINLPNRLFFGTHSNIDLSQEFGNTKKMANATVLGLIDILHKYKFTVEENTPLVTEVALDPEFLGKIFENLLAVRNPETGETARKATGSFYTPREIVDYMIDESLLAYLKTQEIALENLDNLENLTQTEKEQIINALDKLKILDPACGSGAFPMGVLQKIQHILKQIDPNNKLWFESLINSFPNYVRAEMRKKFEKENLDYLRKLGIILKSIYGVDIQPIAVQISKLRCFLSLIIDQKTNTNPADNFGVKPLPNLEFKFVAANALIDVPKLPDGITSLQTILTDFAENTETYFSAENVNKATIKQKISNNITDLIDYHTREINRLAKQNLKKEKEGKQTNRTKIDETTEHIRLWNSFENIFKEETVGFFNPTYCFPEVKNGFDVVIGNPPYIQLQKMKAQQESFEKQGYATYSKASDLYCLFYEKGVQLLKEKGILAYITSNSWMRTQYGELLRTFFAEQTNPLLLLNFENSQVFESAIVESNILIAQKTMPLPKNTPKTIQLKAATITDEAKNMALPTYIADKHILLTELDTKGWIIGTNKTALLKKKIELGSVMLKDLNINIYSGVKTGFNDAFLINSEQRKILTNELVNSNLIKSVLRGKDVKRWYTNNSDNYLLFIPWHFPLKKEDNKEKNILEIAEKKFKTEYSLIYDHLSNFKKELAARNKAETGLRYEWYALQRCATDYWQEFEKPKISWLTLADEGRFSYDEEGVYLLNSMYFLTGENLKYLLAILNSKLSNWYFHQISTSTGMGTNMWTKYKVEQLPIKNISATEQAPFIVLVDKILAQKSKGENTQELENEIDALVFGLYGLTEEEITVVRTS